MFISLIIITNYCDSQCHTLLNDSIYEQNCSATENIVLYGDQMIQTGSIM